jgi:hypothetical protein
LFIRSRSKFNQVAVAVPKLGMKKSKQSKPSFQFKPSFFKSASSSFKFSFNDSIFSLINEKEIDYFLFLSTFEETYSFTLSIALKFGLPIIYNNIGCYRERLTQYNNCFPFSEDNYMEIHNMNNIDETAPYNVSQFTTHTNETNGIVNSAFAKIAIPTTPLSQWFDDNIDSYMLYNPPAERLSRTIKIRLRYHNGLLVNFGNFEYSIMLELCILLPQNKKETDVYIPESVAYA